MNEDEVTKLVMPVADLDQVSGGREAANIVAFQRGKDDAEEAFLNHGVEPLEPRVSGLFMSYCVARLLESGLITGEQHNYWNERDKNQLLNDESRVQFWLEGWASWMDKERLEQLKS